MSNGIDDKTGCRICDKNHMFYRDNELCSYIEYNKNDMAVMYIYNGYNFYTQEDEYVVEDVNYCPHCGRWLGLK